MASRAERKLAAILAADVVGYSRLMGADEAGTHARLKAHRKEFIEPAIAEYHGRVVKLTGDGALVEFGSAVDAVECAVAIQRGMAEREAGAPEDRRLRFRIGINIGDIILEEGDIYGDGVNVAARLEGLAEPGGICVARSVYNQVKGKQLEVAFVASGPQQVKNIAEPVETYRVALDGVAPAPAAARPAAAGGRLPAPAPRSTRWLVPALGALSAIAVLGGAWHFWPAAPPPDGRPGIAVLPFDNLGGDEATGRLADGITEDIITDLARFRDLDVIARNSTAVYAGKPVDVRQVGKDLNVGYVLEGSIQRQDDSVRVTGQLIDAETGAHVWSERWDRPADDIFAVQTEVAEKVAATLGGDLTMGQITRAELQRAKRLRPNDLTAYDYFQLGKEFEGHVLEHRPGHRLSDQGHHLGPAARARLLRPGVAPQFLDRVRREYGHRPAADDRRRREGCGASTRRIASRSGRSPMRGGWSRVAGRRRRRSSVRPSRCARPTRTP